MKEYHLVEFGCCIIGIFLSLDDALVELKRLTLEHIEHGDFYCGRFHVEEVVSNELS